MPVFGPSSIFRLNPDYVLVERNAVPEAVLLRCGVAVDDAQFFGLLIPRREGALTVKAVQCGDAELFARLQVPGPVPEELRRRHPDFEQYLQRLVLDAILEIEVADRFVGGNAVQQAAISPHTRSRSSISYRALLHAARLQLDDPVRLAGRLYTFNRIPTGATALAVSSGKGSVRTYLGVGSRTPVVGFFEVPVSPGRECWIEWARSGIGGERAVCKLYVCVAPDELPAVFVACAELAARHGAIGFKVGADRATLNRPDKLMLYFRSIGDLHAAVPDFTAMLSGVDAHELPFAGTLSSPTLAWGMDPPTDGEHVFEGSSWRMWVCRKLAAALLSAARSGCTPGDAVVFAERRIELDGVDPVTWSPDKVRFA